MSNTSSTCHSSSGPQFVQINGVPLQGKPAVTWCLTPAASHVPNKRYIQVNPCNEWPFNKLIFRKISLSAILIPFKHSDFSITKPNTNTMRPDEEALIYEVRAIGNKGDGAARAPKAAQKICTTTVTSTTATTNITFVAVKAPPNTDNSTREPCPHPTHPSGNYASSQPKTTPIKAPDTTIKKSNTIMSTRDYSKPPPEIGAVQNKVDVTKATAVDSLPVVMSIAGA